jgi:hypothetical protein
MTGDKVLDAIKGTGGVVLKTSLDHTKEQTLRDAIAAKPPARRTFLIVRDCSMTGTHLRSPTVNHDMRLKIGSNGDATLHSILASATVRAKSVRGLPWRRPEPGLWAGPAASARPPPRAPLELPPNSELHRQDRRADRHRHGDRGGDGRDGRDGCEGSEASVTAPCHTHRRHRKHSERPVCQFRKSLTIRHHDNPDEPTTASGQSTVGLTLPHGISPVAESVGRGRGGGRTL